MAFKRFVIFAGMRTGSNLLEATLNKIKRVTCFGEAFNPYMMGWPDKDELRGVTMAERDADPDVLLQALFDKPDHLPGFRYFFDHDPRVFDAIMADRDCAKIVLTRNPVDSYVSTRLAWETNQWKLNETEIPKPAAITWDGAEFQQILDDNAAFLRRIQHGLQVSGQAGFWLNYDDLRDADAMTGLLHWLGRTDLERVDPASDQVPQNPREMSQKVQNYDQMQGDLAQMDPFQLTKIPGFEPSRGPAVPSWVANDAGAGLLFLPVRGGPDAAVRRWMGGLGRNESGLTQNALRQWKRKHPGHRSFTVLRHPLRRAWVAWQQMLTAPNPDLRQLLRDIHRVPLPADDALADWPEAAQMDCFAAFLDFLRRNLLGQTTLPVHPIWASQSEVLAGFARFTTPDMVLREGSLHRDLDWLAESTGIDAAGDSYQHDAFPADLGARELTKAAHDAYLRDYVMFGFSRDL
ncbi:MAG: hypothetical protein Q4G24_09760 [Paracoccus sp. (in: a-proteobacteria)]|uniref:hypothetical protein n=1 Tax=Paracoccus sp. TaxID=267 RepID=UPI0026DF20CB|nr:hypothetical protein [Paracoccus sp. (in: a-proteobacteria)]MDO5621743.1 hypothetical protein [Paracoccus sp. (in: a-proteobacteria)]